MNNYPLREEGVVLESPQTAANSESDNPHSKSLDQSILDWFDLFHKWDFITAEVTESKPKWVTISSFPLNSETLYQRWKTPSDLVGVRFTGGRDGKTNYALIDIDIDSQYHPQQNPSSIQSITDALRLIGLYQHIKIRSSSSGGLHLYFPLPDCFNCYKLAIALQQTLEKHGFQIKAGQLEIFPNVKAPRSNYRAHRLPLQTGSFALNDRFQPVHSSLEQLIQTWYAVAKQQNLVRLTEVVVKAKQSRLSNSKDLEEWKQRLETSLRIGFTSHSQTNRLVKEACIYLRVFKGLDWNEIETEAHGAVTDLPGYHQYCRHQREIKRRIRDWVKSNQKSNRYYPVSSCPKVGKSPKAPPNDVRSKDALERIKQAIASLTESGTLSSGVQARQIAICKLARCSATTLRKYKELWHPYFQNARYVTVDIAIAPAISEEHLSSSDHDVPTCSDQESRCVTTGSSTVPSNTKIVSKNVSIAETRPDQAVTHPSLLSVLHANSSEKTISSGDSTDRLISNRISKQSCRFSIGSIVKRREERELLEITAVNSNGTYWAKWINPVVPRVAIILRKNEIILVKDSFEA